MGNYNKNLTMNDLFRNPKMAKILPQFPKNIPLQNVYSFAEIQRRVAVYLCKALGGRKINGELIVKGRHSEVLRKVRDLAPQLEQFFDSMPSLVKNLRSNTPLYTPYAGVAQLMDIKGVDAKMAVMQIVLDNIQYSADFNSLNSVLNEPPRQFAINQAAWVKQVGYKEPKGKR